MKSKDSFWYVHSSSKSSTSKRLVDFSKPTGLERRTNIPVWGNPVNKCLVSSEVDGVNMHRSGPPCCACQRRRHSQHGEPRLEPSLFPALCLSGEIPYHSPSGLNRTVRQTIVSFRASLAIQPGRRTSSPSPRLLPRDVHRRSQSPRFQYRFLGPALYVGSG